MLEVYLLNVLRPPFCTLTTLGYTEYMRMIDEDEVGLKEKPEDTRYIKNITSKQSTGSVGKGLDSNFTIIQTADSGKSAGVSRLKTPTNGFLILVSQDPRRRWSKFLNLNWWKGYCYHKIWIMVPRVGDGDPSFPVQSIIQLTVLYELNKNWINILNI